MDEHYPIRKNHRLSGFTYSQVGAYFLTICTDNRKNLFWLTHEPQNDKYSIPLTPTGMLAANGIRRIPLIYPRVSVDNFIIMPNHIHLLLQIHCAAPDCSQDCPPVPNIIQKFKGSVARQAGFSVWQKSFYDHVIRNRSEYNTVWEYIENNPRNWLSDSLYTR